MDLRPPHRILTGALGVAVPGEGPKQTRVMVVGQNPGREEARARRPFVGRTGRYLDTVLKRCGLDRSQVYLTNIVKETTPGNRKPTTWEVRLWRTVLTDETRRVKPEVVVLMGEVAHMAERLPGIRYLETCHPSAAMRFPAMRQEFEEAFRQLPGCAEVLPQEVVPGDPRQKIVPNLWFGGNAEGAVGLYVSVFGAAEIVSTARYGPAGAEASGMPIGSVMTVTFQLEGHEFTALNGGPAFTFTPAISFFVSCATEQEVDKLWGVLSRGGNILMELGRYPFSEKYGWLIDRFGVSWQMNLAPRVQKIAPCLMFVGEQAGRAEAALGFYCSLFPDSGIAEINRYGKGGQDPEGTVNHAVFSLAGQEFMAMDSALPHAFTFTPAISLLVNCVTQAEIDRLWEKLSDGGAIEQCGWLRDRYGVSWQIVPRILEEMVADKDPVRVERVMKAMLQMKKLDIAGLRQAYAPR